MALTMSVIPTYAQNILDAEDDNELDGFYKKKVNSTRQALPYAFIREDDVVWESIVWRTIDFREKFNQFFYFPTQPEGNTQGRINLINTVMAALKNGEIEAYEDDEFKKPKPYEDIYNALNRERPGTIAIFDEYDEEIGSRDTIYRDEFDPSQVYTINLKEYWYIEKNDTRQKVRIIGIEFMYNYCQEREGERVCTPTSMFWINLKDMRTRNVLVKRMAFDENNNTGIRSYDDVFIDRYFDSYVTRVYNTQNRSISSYMTGIDALVESQRIEEEIFNIESDMWEY